MVNVDIDDVIYAELKHLIEKDNIRYPNVRNIVNKKLQEFVEEQKNV